MPMLLSAFLFYLVLFAMAIYVIVLLHKWVVDGIRIKKEQNEMLRELLEILRAKQGRGD